MSDLVAIIGLSDPRQALVPYNSGIDFIAFHSSLVPRVHPLLSSELTIGLLWWDLILPLALQAIGLKRLHLDSSQFLHLNHTERWSWEFIDRIGRSSTQYLSDAIQANPRVSELALSWFVSYRQMTALRFALGPKDLIRRLLFRHHRLTGPIARPILFAVAAISESFVMNPLLLRKVGCGAGGPKSPSAYFLAVLSPAI